MTASVVRPEFVAADRAWRDINRRGTGRIDEAAVAEHLDRLSPIHRVGRGVAKARLRSRIHRSTGCAARWNRERRHVPPVRTDRLLNAVRDLDAGLAEHVLELERLPPVLV